MFVLIFYHILIYIIHTYTNIGLISWSDFENGLKQVNKNNVCWSFTYSLYSACDTTIALGKRKLEKGVVYKLLYLSKYFE